MKLGDYIAGNPLGFVDLLIRIRGGHDFTTVNPPRKIEAGTYTLGFADVNGYIRQIDPTDPYLQCYLQIPLHQDTPLPAGTTVVVECLGMAGLAIIANPGVTLNPGNGLVYILYQYGVAVLTKVENNTWTVTGAQSAE